MIPADIVRRSLADPEFFYGSKHTNDVIADTARWHRSEHEAGSAGAQRMTKDRKLVHNKQGTQQ